MGISTFSQPVSATESSESRDLVEQARKGSPGALDELLEESRGRLLSFIRRRLGPSLRPHLEAGDILQVTYMRAFQRLGQFEGTGRECLFGWLAKIALNAIRDEVDYLRRQRRCVHRTVALGHEVESVVADERCPVSLLIAREEAERLQRTLRSLGEHQRAVIHLRRYEELSFREIGERLGRSPDACRMLLARSLKALTRKLRSDAASPLEGLAAEDLAATG